MNITAHSDGNTTIWDGDYCFVRIDPVYGPWRKIMGIIKLVMAAKEKILDW